MIKAIIVDDDMTTLEGLARAVSWDKFQVNVCGLAINGAEGLELIEEYQPDLILTDIFMPVMDGIEMLKHIRSDGNDAEVIILSGYEDFKYAQSAVKLKVADYLSKPATILDIEKVIASVTEDIRSKQQDQQEDAELRELLELHRSNTRKLVMKGLLEPNFTHSTFFQKASKELKLSFESKSYTVVVMEYAVPRHVMNVKRSDISIYAYAIRNMVEEMSLMNQEVMLADIQQNIITLIVHMPNHLRDETTKQRIKYILVEYVNNIKKYLNLEVWVALGKTVYEPSAIPSSYMQANNLLAKREYRLDSLFISEDSVTDRKQIVEFPRLMESYQELIRFVMDGQHESLKDQIYHIVDTLKQHESLSLHLVRGSIIELVGLLTISLYDQGIQLEDLDLQKNWYRDIERINHMDDFTSYLMELMLPVCDAVAHRGTHKHRKTVEFMKRYVQEHYSEEITLDDIGDKVFLTRNYLSQIFKQVTGENYNNYITKVRMEKAKEMMLTGKYKLYEIAAMVGYKNNAYFSQQFKKNTGKSPSDFC